MVKIPSHAMPPAVSGPVYEITQRLNNSARPNDSAFMLLSGGLDALFWRILLADLAKQSIDVQYYLIDTDDSSKLFSLALIRAANRGVRIRLLVDDVFLMGRDQRIAFWDEHPNIEIRIFNPWHKRGSLFQRGLEYLGYAERLNQRMHNKLFSVDNQIAIIGGRNIGAAYFNLGKTYSFTDLDVIITGPIVTKVSDSFDLYWNNDWSKPASTFAAHDPKTISRQKLSAETLEQLKTSSRALKANLLKPIDVQQYLDKLTATSIYGQAWAIYDDPPSEVSNETGGRKIEQLSDIDEDITKELLITSPYFVPSEIFLEKLETLALRGVRIRILTNSLASINHTIVHSGYRPWRRQLLDAGIELYEYRDDAAGFIAAQASA